jgi:hypothetical protein
VEGGKAKKRENDMCHLSCANESLKITQVPHYITQNIKEEK